MDQESQMRPIPVVVLTGFLGSGKTTLLNRLLKDPRMNNTAVIINEFGEIGLDHVLVERSEGDVVLLGSGCICCTMQSGLADTLNSLWDRRQKGILPPFERVLIETTGIANPGPILNSLVVTADIASRYALDSVIATIDAVNGNQTLDKFEEALRQAAMADKIIITKSDLAAPVDVQGLQRRIKRLNPAGSIFEVVNGDVSPDELLDASPVQPGGQSSRARWAAFHRYQLVPGLGKFKPRVGIAGRVATAASETSATHDHRMQSFCLWIDPPVYWMELAEWLDGVMREHGEKILRIKGIANVIGVADPVVLHGVQELFHPPSMLDEWPSDDKRTRIVFIVCDVEPDAIENTIPDNFKRAATDTRIDA